jgi:class 3 adenylate cyclase
VQASAPEGVRFEEIGPVELKGIRRPERIFRAVKDEAGDGTAKPGPSS